MRSSMRNRRKELGLSQKQVARLANMTRANYAHIERGRHEPNIRQMEAIARALRIEPTIEFFKTNSYEMEHKQNCSSRTDYETSSL